MSHSPYLDSFSILRNLSFQIKFLYIIRCKTLSGFISAPWQQVLREP